MKGKEIIIGNLCVWIFSFHEAKLPTNHLGNKGIKGTSPKLGHL